MAGDTVVVGVRHLCRPLHPRQWWDVWWWCRYRDVAVPCGALGGVVMVVVVVVMLRDAVPSSTCHQ